ncbi:MAG TPA: amino acid ABC transporter ATP-binding protein [Anaerolineae bacterium]|nr:amino acid ABC transporter ATP-binding protein [Anaerolineae bacterium]
MPTTNHIILKVQNVSKDFGSTLALNNVSLDVHAGEVVVLIGPSGSGKSTLLRSINYLEVPTEGRIWLDGEYMGGRLTDSGQWLEDSPKELARKRQKVGMVFQLFNLFAHLNAIDNVAVGPHKVLGRPKAECRALAEQLLHKVHLADHSQKYPSQLSGGQQQRVAIARALAMNPKLMLFDEPTSALDPQLTWEVLEVMQELAEEGMTMVVVTHELAFAQRAADRVVYLEAAQIVEQGPPQTLFENPQHEGTRKFFSYYTTWGG